MQNTELRPLGAGELLDRAVTLFVRQFVPIVIVLAIAIVPLMILQALIAPNTAHVFTDLGAIFTAASKPSSSGDFEAALAKYNSGSVALFVFGFVTIIVRLLMWSAIVHVVAVAYTSGTVSTPRDAYVAGVNCWPAQILVGIAFTVIAGVCSVPLVIAYFLIIALVFVIVSVVHVAVLAILVAVVSAVVLFSCAAAVGAFVYMTYEIASIFVVTESPNGVTAITAAIRRVSSRATWWRTAVAGLVVFAMTQIGAIPFALAAGLLTALTHVDAFYFAIVGIGTILLDGLVAAFAVVYATDIRIRREGLDLLALTVPETPLPAPG